MFGADGKGRRRRAALGLAALGFACGAAATAGVWLRPAYTPPAWPGHAARVASLESVELGGSRQWLLVRGRRDGPILLFLHGGPGSPLMSLAHGFQHPLERRFLVVQWDRRGAGKSFAEGTEPASLATSRELADAEELIALLKRRYAGAPVTVVGHSYGAYLGAALAQRRPELVQALVMVSPPACERQDVEAIQDSWLRRQAEAAGDRITLEAASRGGRWARRAALERYGGVIHARLAAPLGLRAWLAPEYDARDVMNIERGLLLSQTRLRRDGPAFPLARSVPALQVPTYAFLGRNDMVTPTLCADRYLAALQAPLKRAVWFEDSAHYPFLEEPERFASELTMAAAGQAGAPR